MSRAVYPKRGREGFGVHLASRDMKPAPQQEISPKEEKEERSDIWMCVRVSASLWRINADLAVSKYCDGSANSLQ
jgi:hypothetical protein